VIVDLAIRAAEMSDAAALASLMCELGYETSATEMQDRLAKIGRDPQYRTFVAVAEGKVCGMISTLALYSHEHNDLGGRIIALVVANKSRRSGIGRRLIAVAEHDFAQRNITRVALNAQFAREGAHKFYETLGYSRNGFRFVKTLRPPG
jgi:ribosomal protein S18 acetylase RimI-like enzyme